MTTLPAPPPSFDTDLAAAAARLGKNSDTVFALPKSEFRKVRALDKARRANVRRLISPKNATCVVDALPEPGGHSHCILRGDFVLCDLIPAVIADRGHCSHLRITTLGLSVQNAQTLLALLDSGAVGRLTLLVSHYFAQVDKESIFRKVEAMLAGRATLTVSRNHTKIILLPVGADHFVLEGSANLRSSDNIEQLAIFNDPDTLAFHARWIDSVRAS